LEPYRKNSGGKKFVYPIWWIPSSSAKPGENPFHISAANLLTVTLSQNSFWQQICFPQIITEILYRYLPSLPSLCSALFRNSSAVIRTILYGKHSPTTSNTVPFCHNNVPPFYQYLYVVFVLYSYILNTVCCLWEG
jgi:hypothetical protein